MSAKKKMCGDKSTFYSKQRAVAHAAKYGQRVYECPICFCWHCTSKSNWRHEYVDAAQAKKDMQTLERKLRTEYNTILNKKNRRINELELAVARTRHNQAESEKP
ncbi:MAG TPA: hypothetical protein VFE62_26200 [Gemmataceae bacterium]|nr:hypothetical protein [Gemmataceae bacterium]